MFSRKGTTPLRRLMKLALSAGEPQPANLFDKTKATADKIWWKGNTQTSAGFSASDKIAVVPGETYTMSRSAVVGSTAYNQAMYFDAEGTYLTQDLDHWWQNPSTYTIPDGVYFVAFNVATSAIDDATFMKA